MSEIGTPTKYKQIGKVKDAFGLQGELYVLIFSKDVSWAKSLTTFVLEHPATRERLVISGTVKTAPHKNGLRVKTAVFVDRTAAEKVRGHFFLIPEELLISRPGESIYLNEIEGFRVLTETETVGVVTGFSSNGAQDLLLVTSGEKRCEIPLVEQFIVEIDFQEKFIMMNLPPGLTDLSSL